MTSNLPDRLFGLFSHPQFLAMSGLANEAPIFIQTYDIAREDETRRMVENLTCRLQNAGITVASVDLFNLVLDELKEHQILDDLLQEESRVQKADLMETLQN